MVDLCDPLASPGRIANACYPGYIAPKNLKSIKNELGEFLWLQYILYQWPLFLLMRTDR